MLNFTYDALPGRVLFAAGASRAALRDEVARLGVRRVLLLATPRELPFAQELCAPLGEMVVGTFTGVRPHVPVEVAAQARTLAAELAVDCLLSIGGGATTGTAKAIALETRLPIVAVPTTYAGSEMTPIYGLTSGQQKRTGRALAVLPRVVIYDPELTYALPASISGPSAINALAHCVEAFYAPGANPISALMAEEGIRALARGVPVAVAQPNDAEGRAQTLYGAYLAGAALAVAGSGLHHKICHVLGGAYDLPHAAMHTIILPHAVAFLEPAIPEVAARIARALGAAAGGSAAAALYALNQRIGAPHALKDIGLRADQFEAAVGLTLQQISPAPPRPLDEVGARSILGDAIAGRPPRQHA